MTNTKEEEKQKKNNKKTSKILKLSYRIVIVSPLILGLVLVSKIDHLGFVSDSFFRKKTRSHISYIYIYVIITLFNKLRDVIKHFQFRGPRGIQTTIPIQESGWTKKRV